MDQPQFEIAIFIFFVQIKASLSANLMNDAVNDHNIGVATEVKANFATRLKLNFVEFTLIEITDIGDMISE